MGKYSLIVAETARKELQKHYHSGNKSTIKQIEKIFAELEQHPFTGTGKPEKLKYKLLGYWSRRLNKKDRLIYRVDENNVKVLIVSARGHYSDK